MWLFLLILGLFSIFGIIPIAKTVLKNTFGEVTSQSRYGERRTEEQIAELKQQAADTINGYLSKIRIAAYAGGAVFILWGLLSTSYYRVPTKHTGHLIKKYSIGSTAHLSEGQVIATKGKLISFLKD
jgi:hypothetical protein